MRRLTKPWPLLDEHPSPQRLIDMPHKVIYSSVRMDWETPQSVFDPLNAEFAFTLDAAADASNHKVARYYDEQADGLSQSWADEVVWLNPPYGSAIRKWTDKAVHESSTNNATVVMLVPSRTDTRWWHDCVINMAEVRFVKGRVRFVGATAGAPFPSAILVYRPTAR